MIVYFSIILRFFVSKIPFIVGTGLALNISRRCVLKNKGEYKNGKINY